MEDILWPPTDHDGDGRGLTPEFSWDWGTQNASGNADAISFSLVDARTDEIVRPLTVGDLIDASQLSDGIFSIIAQVDDSLQAESVVFKLNGKRVRTESIEPYALFSDNPYSGNIFGKELFEVGDYELEATAYSKNGGRGHKLATASLPFSVVPDPTNTPPLAIADDYVVEEDGKLKEPALGVLENDEDSDGDSLKVVEVNGSKHKVGKTITLESGARLKLNDDGSFKYDPNGKFDHLDDGEVAFDSFDYVISDGRGGRSTATSTITIQGLTDPPDIRFFLVDADADVILRELKSGDNIEPAEFDGRTFSIIAKVDRKLHADSLVFELNGETVKTENFIPYALFGDNLRGDIAGRSLFEPGNYQLEASAFSRNYGRGREVAEATLEFTIGGPSLNVAVTAVTEDSGAVAEDGVTSDDTLVISGTATPDSEVEVFIDGAQIGNTTADGNGDWSLDHTSTPLGEGDFEITARASDTGGNSADSDPFALSIDQTPPAEPVFDLAPGSDSGSQGDKTTNISPVTLEGTTDPNTAVKLEPLGLETTSDGAGAFSFTNVPLAEGDNEFTVVAMDLAGNSSRSTMTLVLDSEAPAVSVSAISEDTGKEANDGITSDDTLIINGNATLGSTVEVFVDGGSIGFATVDGGGAWSLDHSGTALGEGDFEITAVATDLAGNATTSSAFPVTIDKTAPAVAVTGVTEDTGAAGDGLTNDDTLVISGTATPGSDVEVFLDGGSIGTTTADGSGLWSLDHTGTALGEGDFEITAQAKDLAGNTTDSAPFDLTVDQTPPAEPLFDLAAASDGGAAGDKATDISPVTFEGTTDPNTAVRLEPLGLETTSDGGGAFAFANVDLVLGDNEFTVVATDAAGNSSSSTMTFVLQPAAPVVAVTAIEQDTGTPGDGVTMDDTLVISGTATPSTQVEVFIDGGSIGTTNSDGDGNWSFDHSGTTLGEGNFVITAEVGGGGGTSTSNDFPVTVDQTAPAVAVTSIQDDRGADSSDGITNDATLVINGTAEPNIAVEVFIDGLSVGTTLADGSGDWSFDNSESFLGEGSFEITAKATDLAGNMTESAVFEAVVDLTGPAAPTLALPAPFDSGVLGDLITNINPVTLTGTSDPNTPITIAPLGLATTTDGTGNFEFTGVVLSEGPNELTVTATDELGNESVSLITVILDTLAPIIDLVSPDEAVPLDASSRLQGSVDGTGSAIASLTYQFDPLAVTPGAEMPVSFNLLDGSFDVPIDISTLGLGEHEFDVLAFDLAGNLAVSVLFLDLNEIPPLTLGLVSPVARSGEVGVTFHPEISFSRPVDPDTLTANSFFATDPAGNVIPANIIKKLDGTGAFLFFDDPLPGASQITVHVVGDLIEGAADAALLDGDGDGVPGGEFTYSFTTVNQEAVPGTTLIGRAVDPGPDLVPGTADDVDPGTDGEFGTDDDIFLLPIAGATVFILGRESEAVHTDANGFFELTSVPSGNVKVAIDGRTASSPPAGKFFPEMVMDMTVRPGIENTIPGGSGTPEQQAENQGKQEVYLPRLDESMLVPVSDSDETLVLANAVNAPELTPEQRLNLNLLVQPGSLIGPDGLPLATPEIGISTVPAVLVSDMLPQGLLQHTFDITIQAPDAAIFAEPIQATFPNVFDAPPGTQLNFLSFDHTTGRLVIEGTATVSANGLSVTTDPDTGIVQPGWHGLTPPGSPGMGPDTPPDPKDNNITEDEWKHIFDDAFKDYSQAFKAFGVLGRLVAAAGKYKEDLPKIIDSFNKMKDGFGANDSLSLMKTVVQGFAGTKDAVVTAFDLAKALTPAGAIDKAIALLDIAKGTINFNKNLLIAKRDPECPNPSLENAISKLEFYSLNVASFTNTVTSIKMLVEGKLIEGALGALCGFADPLVAAINKKIQDAENASQQQGQGLVALAEGPVIEAALADNLPITELFSEEELAEINTQIDNGIIEAQALIDDIAEVDLIQLQADTDFFLDAVNDVAAAAGQLYVSAFGNPGNAYYRLTSEDGFELRGRTGVNGELDVFLPAETELTLQIYDARTNSIGETSFTTAQSGQTTEIPIPFYFNVDGLADADGDLLADDAETIVGTDVNLADSDNDGISDFVEIRDGLNPFDGIAVGTGILASLPLSGEAMEIVIEGSSSISEGELAYVATGSFGLAVIDVSNALLPLALAELNLPGTSVDVAVEAALGIAVLAGGAGGLHFVDVSDPSSPTLLSSATIEPSQVKIFDGLAIANDATGLKSFDLTTGEELQALDLGGADIIGLAREGAFLYVTDSDGLLTVIEIAGRTLTERGSVLVADGGGRPFVGDGIVYLPSDRPFNGGFATVDVSDPDNPTIISLQDEPGIANGDLALNGSGIGVFVGGGPGIDATNLDVVDVSDPNDTGAFLTRIPLPADAQGVAIGAGLAFVANGTSGLQVVNYLELDDQGVPPEITVTGLPTDVDPVADGIQVIEGRPVALGVSVTDDVQVRSVELLLNDRVVRSDVSFPFELFAPLPTIAANSDSQDVILQVRVTDTGGNATLSDEIAIELVPDLTAPQLMAQSVNQDDVVGGSTRTFSFTFDEPITTTSVSHLYFKLIDPFGDEVMPTSLQLSLDGTEVRLTYAPLAQGPHKFELDAAIIADLAGNPLGAGILTTDFTVNDFTVTFTGGGDGVSWFDPDNWSTGEVPDETDDVLIDIPGDATINFLGGVDEVVVSRLVLQETLNIQAGMLRVTNEAELNGVILTAGQLALDGTSSIVDLTVGNGTLDGAGTTTVSNSLVWDGKRSDDRHRHDTCIRGRDGNPGRERQLP